MESKKRRAATAIVLLAVVTMPLSLPFALVPMNARLADFMHRQLAYRVIGERVTQNAATDMERVMAVMAYVYLNEAQPEDWGHAEDRHVLHDLVRHVGWCDQKANAMAHLLMPVGIRAHMVMFPCHTFADVTVDGRQLLFDPKHNSYFFERGIPGQLASLSEVLSRPREMLTRHGEHLTDYEDADILDCGRPVHWTAPEESLSRGRKALDGMMGFAFRIGGQAFSKAFNRWYLLVSPEEKGPMYRARLLDLFGDADGAGRLYAEAGGNRALFFLFKNRLENGDNGGAVAALGRIDPRPGGKEDILYAMVLTDYLTKLGTMDGSELMRLLRMDEDGLTALFDLLDGNEVRQWMLSLDRAESF